MSAMTGFVLNDKMNAWKDSLGKLNTKPQSRCGTGLRFSAVQGVLINLFGGA